jgi:hypothetical protein
MELTPNEGRLWSPAEKENYLLSLCETAIVVATPDEIQDGSPIPRLDVSFEIGRLRETKKTIILKEKSVKLPTSLEPICIYFNLQKPQECLENLDKELESIFGRNILAKALGYCAGYRRAYLRLGFGARQEKKIVSEVF